MIVRPFDSNDGDLVGAGFHCSSNEAFMVGRLKRAMNGGVISGARNAASGIAQLLTVLLTAHVDDVLSHDVRPPATAGGCGRMRTDAGRWPNVGLRRLVSPSRGRVHDRRRESGFVAQQNGFKHVSWMLHEARKAARSARPPRSRRAGNGHSTALTGPGKHGYAAVRRGVRPGRLR